jgi:tripeptide aminopeptidase
MNILNLNVATLRPLAPALGLAVFSTAAVGGQLEFGVTAIEPTPRVYGLDAAWTVDADAIKAVNAERLAESLMKLLPVHSQSCREQPIAAAARALLISIPGMQAGIDDLPQRYAALDDEQKIDLACDSGTVPPQSGNLVATLPGDPELPSWNLSFHLDTNQVLFDGFRRDGDLIRPPAGSPLGADDKAGLAIIHEVVSILHDRKLPHGDIHIVGLAAEEDGAAGAFLIDAKDMRGDILVSVDGGEPQEVGRAAPTNYSGYLTVRTQTSHPASVHDKKSVSACAVGARILHEAGFRPQAFPEGNDNLVLHSFFMSCGIDKGRTTPKGEPIADYQYNSISPFWTASWQLRSLEGADQARQTVAGIKSTMERVCEEAAFGRTPVTCAITGTERPGLTGYVIDENAPAVRLLQSAFVTAQAGNAVITTRQFGGFNGNHIKERFDAEMLLMGTGGDQAHTNEETVSVKGMALVARLLLAAILESARYVRIP